MAVVLQNTGTVQEIVSSNTTQTYTGLTISAGLTNSALLAILVLGAGTTSSGFSATWGGTSMTVIGSLSISGGAFDIGNIVLFGLVAPASGNQNLVANWTTVNFASMCAVSFSGVKQSSVANAFAHFNSTTSSGGAPSLAITSAVNNMVVGVVASGVVSAVGQTQIYLYAATNTLDSGAERAAGASSVTVSGTTQNTVLAGICGVDVVAQAITGGPTLKTYLRR